MQYRLATGGNWTVDAGAWTAGALTYTIPGLTNDVEYDVQVRAVNVTGGSGWSDAEAGAPQPPAISFGQSAYTVDEGSTLTVTIVLDSSVSQQVLVPVSVRAGTAAQEDFGIIRRRGDVINNITVRPGLTEYQTRVLTHDGTDDETVNLSFSSLPNGLTAGVPATAVITILVDDEPNAAPVFSSDSAFLMAENTTAVGTVAADDEDAEDSVTGYTISGGADETKFSINGSGPGSATFGALTFVDAPDFEAGTDANGEVTSIGV